MVVGRLDRYPFPLAYPAHIVTTARDPADRLERAGHCVEMAAVTLGVLALGWCRTHGKATDALQQWETDVERKGVALGGWIVWLKAAGPVLADAQRDPLARAVGLSIEAALPRLDGFTPTRNQYAHGGRPRLRSDVETAASDLMLRVSTVLESVEPLTSVRIAVVRETVPADGGGYDVDLDVCAGYAEVSSPQRLPSRRPFEPGTVVAYSRDSLRFAAGLTPYCLFHECAVCGRDELFYLTKRRRNRADHYTFSTGHELRLARDRTVESSPPLAVLGMEPLGSRRTEAATGWRASWADLAPRHLRLAARSVDAGIVVTLATAAFLLGLAAGLSLGWAALAAVVLSLAFEPATALRAASPGKRLLGIEAISVWDSRPLGKGDALRRAIFVDAQLLFPPLALRSLAWILWDPARQALHDRKAGAIVVSGRSERGHKL